MVFPIGKSSANLLSLNSASNHFRGRISIYDERSLHPSLLIPAHILFVHKNSLMAWLGDRKMTLRTAVKLHVAIFVNIKEPIHLPIRHQFVYHFSMLIDGIVCRIDVETRPRHPML